jgi:3-oxoacyl-[acyl-carrier protein] reductase
MDLGIKGRRAIVTGGSRGIGYQTAKRFLEEGTRVLICARGAEELDESREKLAEETGGEVTALQADTSQEGSAEKIVDSALEAFGGVDILVNNAGEMSSGRFEVMTDEGLQTQLNTKLFGFLRLIRAVVPHMKKRWGRIVNLIGGAGKEPDP